MKPVRASRARRVLGVVAATMALLATQFVVSSSASAATTNWWFRNVKTNKCLDAAGTHPGAWVIQYDCHWGQNQLWYYSTNSRGNSVIKNKASNLCLSIDRADGNYGTPLVLWYCDDNWSQEWGRWEAGWAPNGEEQMVWLYSPHYDNLNRPRVVDVPAGTTQNGARMITWPQGSATADYNQLWTDHWHSYS
ncbi:RICIN domain-containing protein [Streptomyces sp. HUAS MG47]|uniref:RICIN domain-containing protein n=1 Tax=Streptomyces solicamelliae TaxID=3231716 RepID=UPI0038779EEC